MKWVKMKWMKRIKMIEWVHGWMKEWMTWNGMTWNEMNESIIERHEVKWNEN